MRKKPTDTPIAASNSGESFLRDLVEKALLAKKAKDIRAIDVTKLIAYTDYFLICSASSEQHVRALARQTQLIARQREIIPLSVEGTRFNRWVLIDFGTVMVHIFLESLRQFYDLERLWTEGKELDLKLPKQTTAFWEHMEDDEEWLDEDVDDEEFAPQDQDPEMPEDLDELARRFSEEPNAQDPNS